MCCPLALSSLTSLAILLSLNIQGRHSIIQAMPVSAYGIEAFAGTSADTDYHTLGPGDLQNPTVVSPIADLELSTLSAPARIDLNTVFASTNGSTLSFEALSNESGVVELDIEADTLLVSPIKQGTVRVRVIARDERNRQVSDIFNVSIVENNPPVVSPLFNIGDQQLIQGATPFTLNLFTVFIDRDGDPLHFTVVSNNALVSTPVVENNVLIAPANAPGTTRLTIFADDRRGGVSSVQLTLEVLRPYANQMEIGFEVEFGEASNPTSYRLLSMPTEKPFSLTETLPGEPLKDWIAYMPHRNGEGELVVYDPSDPFQFQPGRGAWVLSTQLWQVNRQSIPTVPLTPQGTYSIPLHPGWNIISNPFDIDLNWADVSQRNTTSQALWSWEGGYEQAATFQSVRNTATAYYFYNAENATELELPYPNLANPFVPKQASQDAHLLASIQAIHETGSRAAIEIGFLDESLEGLDSYDLFAPPQHFTTMGLFIESLQGSSDQLQPASKHLARDIQPDRHPVTTYNIKLHAKKNTRVELHIERKTALLEKTILLVNALDGTVHDSDESDRFFIDVQKKETPFVMLVGERHAVLERSQSIIPQEFTLKQNYPNPFSRSTIITFSLQTDQQITLDVYDNVGRLVQTLVHATLEAGVHQINWDGTHRNGHRVASGVYHYQLTGTTSRLSRGMVFLR